MLQLCNGRRLTTTSASRSQMSVITQVALNDNKIASVPRYAWQAFRWVTMLSIAKNKLTSIDDGARLLSAVEVLDASENPITTVSDVRRSPLCAYRLLISRRWCSLTV